MTRGIHPSGLAEMNQKRAGEKYQPSNGTEGEYFFSSWCRRCQRDKAMREGADYDECDDSEICHIPAKTMRFKIEDKEYPKEWRYGNDGQPCCVAFVPAGEPIPENRCELTGDMFEPIKEEA